MAAAAAATLVLQAYPRPFRRRSIGRRTMNCVASVVGTVMLAFQLIAIAHLARGDEQSCGIDGHAPVCPGNVPRSADGCCWRNGKSEDIDNYSGGDVVDSDYVAEVGEEVLEIACVLDQAGCIAADSGDWAEEWGDSDAADIVKFYAKKLKDTAENLEKMAEAERRAEEEKQSSRRRSSDSSSRRRSAKVQATKDYLKDKAKDVAIEYLCDHAKVECEAEGDRVWPWIVLPIVLVIAYVCYKWKKAEDSG